MSTESTQRKILKALPQDGSPIHFEELLRHVKGDGVTRQTLSTHLAYLTQSRTVFRKAMEIKGRARMTYSLILPIPALDAVKFGETWAKSIELWGKKSTEARDALSAFDAQLNITAPTPPEFWLPYLQANEDIGRMVYYAVATLGTVVLSILRDYSHQDDPAVAAQYLKVAADSYIPNLIRDVARLTPPGSNFDYPAMGIAVAGLLGEDAIKESVRQMWKDMQGSNKSEREEK